MKITKIVAKFDFGWGRRLTLSVTKFAVHIRNERVPLPIQLAQCRYNWHSAGSPGRPFPMLKYYYIFQTKYTKQFYQTAL